MENSQHVGKAVVALDNPPPIQKQNQPLQLATNGTYLVVGGLEGFGAATARWLAARGAQHLVLAGRRGPATPGTATLIKALASLGADAKVYSVDVSKFEEVQSVVNIIDASGFPLCGIIHAAMVLDDARLSDLTPKRFHDVVAPKMLGGINLDRVTRGRNLNLFVMFSSAAATFGNIGQSNYVAGNLFLEALIRNRRRAGLPGLAIAWGAIGEVGYLARNKALEASIVNHLGLQLISPAEAFALLEELLVSGADVVTVGRYDWAKVRQALPSLRLPRYSHVIHMAAAETHKDADDLLCNLRGLSRESAASLVEEVIAEAIAAIFRTVPERIDRNRRFDELGMDSLMAVEFGAVLERRFGYNIPVMEIIGTGGVRELALGILSRLALKDDIPLDHDEASLVDGRAQDPARSGGVL
jgi:NADP-dependent 3-hydroxy acid dehydrogenase YdfG/acyl carrier protein